MTEMQHKLCQFLRKTTNHSFPKYKRVVLVSASEHGIEHGINKVLPSAHMSSKTDWNLSQKFSNSLFLRVFIILTFLLDLSFAWH